MNLDLNHATLIKRYKRFLADITLDDGSTTTIHCANTGAMTGCAEPGDSIYYSTSNNPKRKYPFSWELTFTQQEHWICVNTIRANQLAEQALLNHDIAELTDFHSLQREVKYGEENSKIDFLLTDKNDQPIYIEVKSVTLLEGEQGYFPDAKTVRGQKHLRELMHIAEQGQRAVLLFAVLHSGIQSVKAAQHIDPVYAQLLAEAKNKGVEIIAYQAQFNLDESIADIKLTRPLSVIFD